MRSLRNESMNELRNEQVLFKFKFEINYNYYLSQSYIKLNKYH